MRHNGRRHMQASAIHPNDISVQIDGPVTLVCPGCTTWRTLRRGMIIPHRRTDRGGVRWAQRHDQPAPAHLMTDSVGQRPKITDPNGRLRDDRCPGSGQRVKMDLTPEDWAERMVDGVVDAAHRRPTQVAARKPTPLAAPPASKMPRASFATRSALAAHQTDCRSCRTGLRPCGIAAELQDWRDRFERAAF